MAHWGGGGGGRQKKKKQTQLVYTVYFSFLITNQTHQLYKFILL